MKKYNYIFIVLIIIISLFSMFSVILYSNIKSEIIKASIINDNFTLLSMEPYVKNSMEMYFNSTNADSNVHLENLYAYMDSAAVREYIDSYKLFVDNDSLKIFRMSEDSFNIVNNYIFKHFFLCINSYKYKFRISSFNNTDTNLDDMYSKFNALTKINPNYGYFETKKHIINYRNIMFRNYDFSIFMIRDKSAILKELNDFAVLIGIVIFIASVISTLFVILFINASTKIVKIEERTRREIEFIRLNKLLGIEQLSESIIHNINNPLASIKGYLQIIENKDKEISEKYRIPRILNKLNVISDQINFILNKTRRDMSDEIISIDVNEMISDILKLKSNSIQMKNIELRTNINEMTPEIRGIFGDCSMIVENLLDNAMDSMFNSDEKILSIETSYDQDELKIIISDTGCGMNRNEMDNMFDLYFTTKPKSSYNGEPVGTGIGLYSVKRAAMRNNWQIRVFSEKNKGSKFELIMELEHSKYKNEVTL